MNESIPSVVIDVDEVRWLVNRRLQINKYKLEDIALKKDGKLIIPTKDLVDEWKFTGLNNIDFILCNFAEEEK